MRRLRAHAGGRVSMTCMRRWDYGLSKTGASTGAASNNRPAVRSACSFRPGRASFVKNLEGGKLVATGEIAAYGGWYRCREIMWMGTDYRIQGVSGFQR